MSIKKFEKKSWFIHHRIDGEWKKIGLIGKSRESELINWRNFEEKKKNFTQITWTKKNSDQIGNVNIFISGQSIQNLIEYKWIIS